MTFLSQKTQKWNGETTRQSLWMARAVKCNHKSCEDVTICYMDEEAEKVQNEADKQKKQQREMDGERVLKVSIGPDVLTLVHEILFSFS